jgi:hypothetical protein
MGQIWPCGKESEPEFQRDGIEIASRWKKMLGK